MTAQELIKMLHLKPLPEEGGYYRETFRDQGRISEGSLAKHKGDRSYSTCIYYLITHDNFSKFHSVKSTEIFHFYAGDPVDIVQIDIHGELMKTTLGTNFSEGERPQVVVKPFIWQGTKLKPGGSWALLGCTVAPGFEFDDFQMGARDYLLKRYPQHEEIIVQYT